MAAPGIDARRPAWFRVASRRSEQLFEKEARNEDSA
jgi:hypothetical protein